MSGTVPGPALPSKLPHTQHIYCGHFGLLTPWSFRHVNSMVISVSYLHGHFSILYPEPCLYNQRVPRLPELLSSSNNLYPTLYLISYPILYLVLSSCPSHASNTSST